MGFSMTSPKGGPVILKSPPQTVADMNQIRAYTELVGNRKAGTHDERLDADGDDVWEGLEWYETDALHGTYLYRGGAWRLLHQPVTDWVPTLANMTLGSSGSILAAKYRVTNGLLRADLVMQAGGTGITASDPGISLPLTAASYVAGMVMPIGQWTFDQGPAARYTGAVTFGAAGFRLMLSQLAGILQVLAGGQPTGGALTGNQWRFWAEYPVE